MSNDCKVKTRHFMMIHNELENAIEKHPKFCSAIIDPASSKSWIETERQIKLRNECGPEYADCILMEEMAEAFAAYEKGDKAHALQEFAQCGAVILRIMQNVQNELEKKNIRTGPKHSKDAQGSTYRRKKNERGSGLQ